MSKIIEVDIKNEAVALVQKEIDTWKEQTVFVTERVAFQIRNLLDTLSKNYWGIFNNPNDPNTKKRKVWIPLTESVCDSWVQNIDVNTSDIDLIAKHGDAYGMTALVRTVTHNWLELNSFGEMMDEGERQLAIYGSHVWKTIEVGKRMIRKDVDLRNLFFDMTGSESLQEKYRVTERSLQTVEQIKAMTDWINTDDVVPVVGLHPLETHGLSLRTGTSTTKMIDVYELHGKIPKSLITGKKKDKDEEIEGRIVVSGLEGMNGIVHKIVENTKKGVDGNIVRPYDEMHAKRISGRWLGRGPAESVLMLQLWMNTIVNIRIVRSMVSQLGIFKIKRNSGVSPKQLTRLAVNGAILVKDMDDIEQFVMTEASQSSYTDEGNIRDWARAVTSTFETVTGETLLASTKATNAVLQSRASQRSFSMIKSNIGSAIQRWMRNQAIPILMKNIKKDEIARLTGSLNELQALDKRVVNKMLYDRLKKLEKKGAFIDKPLIARERTQALKRLESMESTRYYKIVEKIDFGKYDVKVVVTNEELDKGVVAQNIISAMSAAPHLSQPLIRQLLDIMGLPVDRLERELAEQAPPPQPESPAPSAPPAPIGDKTFERANLPV